MELKKCIMGRRSIRDFESRKVPEAKIKEILKAGAMAPSARDAQPCRYIVIESREKMLKAAEKVKKKMGLLGLGARLAEKAKIKKDVIFYEAPLLIIVVAEKGAWTEADCNLAAHNMMLRAYDLGIGSCYIGLMNLISKEKKMMRELGVKDSQEIYCPIVFGYPKKWPKQRNREAKVQERIK